MTSDAAQYPDDTADLRTGPEINDRLLALLPLVGHWQGTGSGVAPGSGEQFRFAQRLSFTHDGRPFLAYESRSWVVDDADEPIRGSWRESGFWRPGAGGDDIEVLLASNTGQAMVFTGAAGQLRWELASSRIEPAPTAKQVEAERRLYALVGEQLVYATELTPGGAASAPHLNARLDRT